MSDITVRSVDVLSEREVWGSVGTDVWKAERFTGSPTFYPVYRFENYYSHSVINLVRMKEDLKLNGEFTARTRCNSLNYYSGVDTIDREVTRVGGPIVPARTVRTPTEYARRVADAMQADVLAIEARYPDHQHVVLCGGADSLNILLLPWTTSVIALSAAPNFPLVRQFVTCNGLPHRVLELTDDDTSTLQDEILHNACLVNLAHCRWAGELRGLVAGLGGNVVMWKGQMADVFTTPSWRSYAHSRSRVGQLYRKRVESRLPIISDDRREQRFYRAVWERGAMWQGAHMSLLRSVSGALVLSAYHGDNMTRLFSEVDLRTAVREDVRPAVGRMLHGSAVRYPDTNPGPPKSRWRAGVSDPAHFVTIFRELVGLPIRHD